MPSTEEPTKTPIPSTAPLTAQEKLRTLMDAVMEVGADLNIEQVIKRMVRSASQLASAHDGVIFLATEDHRITNFVRFSRHIREAGVHAWQAPEMLRDLTPSTQPVSIHPGTHPAARLFSVRVGSVLEVEIPLRDDPHGRLYLARSEGAAEFTGNDVETVRALATAAGVAIENARLFARERRRHQWLEATAEMIRLLLGEVDSDHALHLITRRLREVSGADYSGIVLLDQADPSMAVLKASQGFGPHQDDTRTPTQGLAAQVVTTGRGIVSRDLAHEPGYNPPASWRNALSELGLGMLMPLNVPEGSLGVLFAGWRRGSPDEPFAAAEAPLVEMFASHAALALQQVQAQEDRSRLLVLEDRDRIARDLHDVVIHRLFTIGTTLQSAVGLSTRPEVRRRVSQAIEDLDATSRDVRSAIFELGEPPNEPASIRAQLLKDVDLARETIGFTPRLVVGGAFDRGLPSHIRGELGRAVREALAHAASHAPPSQVEVVLRVNDGTLVLLVTDDGAAAGDDAMGREGTGNEATVGEAQAGEAQAGEAQAGEAQAGEAEAGDDDDHLRGLAYLQARAKHLGGSCTTRPSETGGMILEWRVPLVQTT
ncbi:GAF domain-containing protein [Actinopolymorpha alba]|uniref:sensor histidine kinase n=1 Tax=Actinopolymorpha alba TaxID=533267 RepID=UPI00039A35E5|nr:GAF domain-containing protein [Actinopolymorpha alba]